MTRKFLLTAVAAVSLLAFTGAGFAATTAHGTKSNQSERMGGGGKSNSSDKINSRHGNAAGNYGKP